MSWAVIWLWTLVVRSPDLVAGTAVPHYTTSDEDEPERPRAGGGMSLWGSMAMFADVTYSAVKLMGHATSATYHVASDLAGFGGVFRKKQSLTVRRQSPERGYRNLSCCSSRVMSLR